MPRLLSQTVFPFLRRPISYTTGPPRKGKNRAFMKDILRKRNEKEISKISSLILSFSIIFFLVSFMSFPEPQVTDVYSRPYSIIMGRETSVNLRPGKGYDCEPGQDNRPTGIRNGRLSCLWQTVVSSTVTGNLCSGLCFFHVARTWFLRQPWILKLTA